MQTRLTELLGIKYPIVEASMAWITDAEMAAAVSNAGGLGTIGPNAGLKTVTADVSETGERLREQIKKCREMTDKPFAVNFVVGVVGWDRDYSDRCVKVGIDEEVPVAIISQGSPQVYTQRLKETGMKVIHVCSTVRHVKKAEAEGVDAVVVSGTEGGGHSGFDQITTFCLGLVGALALGAEGIYMGTRFMATKECPTHPNVKQAVLAATDTSTIAVRHGSPAKATGQNTGDRGFVEERRGSVRMLINDYMKRIMTEKGADLTFDSALEASDEQESNPESNRTVAAFVHGDLEKNSITVGQGSGLIHDVPSCKELIERIVHEAEPVLERLNNMYKT
ncbi:MAG: nitronate monooxygenase [Deltaproteobacteria bacterium]|nr:nitronate monooxygenase [Deltaproteobacteria bacterium]